MTVYVRTRTAGTGKYINVAKVEYDVDEFVITLACKEHFTARYPKSEVIDVVIEP